MKPRRIRIGAMHNRTQPPHDVVFAFEDGQTVEIPSGRSVKGPWDIVFYPNEHPNLANVANETDITFHGADDSFDFNAVLFRG